MANSRLFTPSNETLLNDYIKPQIDLINIERARLKTTILQFLHLTHLKMIYTVA